jgi:hypothetical protein
MNKRDGDSLIFSTFRRESIEISDIGGIFLSDILIVVEVGDDGDVSFLSGEIGDQSESGNTKF